MHVNMTISVGRSVGDDDSDRWRDLALHTTVSNRLRLRNPVALDPMAIDRYTMRTYDVARELNVSSERVRQLDEELRPVRCDGSNHRRYDPRRVARLAKIRKR